MIGKTNSLVEAPYNPCTKDVCFDVWHDEVCIAWYAESHGSSHITESKESELVRKVKDDSEDTLFALLSALRRIVSPLDIAKLASRFGTLKITSQHHSLHRHKDEPLPLIPLGIQIAPVSAADLAKAVGGVPIQPRCRSAANRALEKYPAPEKTVSRFHQSVGFYLDARDMVLLVGRLLLCAKAKRSTIRSDMEQIGISFTPSKPARPEEYELPTPSKYVLDITFRSSEYEALVRQATTFKYSDDAFYARPSGLAKLENKGSRSFRLEYKCEGEMNDASHIKACEAMADAVFSLHLLEVETYTADGGYIRWNCKSLLGAMWFRLAEITTNGRVDTCRVCGLPFFNDTERGSAQKYCSSSCQRAAQSKGIAVPRGKSPAQRGDQLPPTMP